MKNFKYHTNVVKRRCENKLRIKFRKGKEFNGWFILNNLKIARVTIPKGKKPIPPKTYKSMAQQLKLSIEQFDNLLECPLGYEEYVALIDRE